MVLAKITQMTERNPAAIEQEEKNNSCNQIQLNVMMKAVVLANNNVIELLLDSWKRNIRFSIWCFTDCWDG